MAAQKDEWQQWEGWWWRVDSVTGWWQRAERVDMRAEAARSVRGPSLMQQLSVDPSGRTPEVSSPIDPVPSMGACSAPAMQPWCEAALGMQPTAVTSSAHVYCVSYATRSTTANTFVCCTGNA